MKPQPGSYRPILVANLDTHLSKQFEDKVLKLGVVQSFQGNVKTCPDLHNVVMDCFKSLPDNEIAQYYLKEMEQNRITVVNDVLTSAQNDNMIFKPGELFFRS